MYDYVLHDKRGTHGPVGDDEGGVRAHADRDGHVSLVPTAGLHRYLGLKADGYRCQRGRGGDHSTGGLRTHLTEQRRDDRPARDVRAISHELKVPVWRHERHDLISLEAIISEKHKEHHQMHDTTQSGEGTALTARRGGKSSRPPRWGRRRSARGRARRSAGSC